MYNNTEMLQILSRTMLITKTGIYRYDIKKKHHFACDSLMQWFSEKEQKAVKQYGLFGLMHAPQRRKIRHEIKKALSDKKSAIAFNEHLDLQKGPGVFGINIDLFYDENGEPDHLIVIVNDITEHEQTKAVLQKEKEIAEKNAIFRAKQLAHMSHEIRTPIGGITGMTDVLLSENHDEKTIEKLKIIRQSADLMMEILTTTLDHCKIMASGISLNKTNVSPHDLLASTCLFWQDKARENGIKISYELADEIPPLISIDEYRIKQCLNNLMSNALKFTKNGRVDIRMQVFGKKLDVTQLAIIVKDTGIGMNAAERKKIFTPFEQADKNVGLDYGGTGLGMSIVQKIVKAMKGYIIVKSKKNVGTLVALILPLEPAIIRADASHKNNDDSDKNKKKTKHNANILIVDDIPTNRIVLEYMLCEDYKNLEFAENGQQAIDVLTKKPIDIVLMDIHMPILNGVEAVKQIRSKFAPYRNVPIIAVTADGDFKKKIQDTNHGFNGFLEKPVQKDLLHEKIESILSNKKNIQAEKELRQAS